MPDELVKQQAYVPTRKVGMGQAAGSAVTIASYFVEEYSAMDIPLFIGTAGLQLVMFGVQYWVKDSTR